MSITDDAGIGVERHRAAHERGADAAGVDVRAHDRVTLFLRGNNIGDAAYDSVLGYPGLPRAFVAGARVRFGASR